MQSLKKNKFLGKKLIKFIKSNRGQNEDLIIKNLFEAQYVLEVNKVKKEVLTIKEKMKVVEVLKFNDNEFNDLGYKKAFKYDHRTFFQYYLSLLFTKHIIFQIFKTKDYNAYSINYFLMMIQCIKYMKTKVILILYINFLR